MLEGPDVYCPDEWKCDPSVSCIKDGKLNSKTKFCRVEVEPFPFCVKLFWDGSKDWAEIPGWGPHASRLYELWNMQMQPEIAQRRSIGALYEDVPPQDRHFTCHRPDRDPKGVSCIDFVFLLPYLLHFSFSSSFRRLLFLLLLLLSSFEN